MHRTLFLMIIFLTSLSSWSQVAPPGVEVINAGDRPIEDVIQSIQTKAKDPKSLSAVELVRQDLLRRGLAPKPKPFLILQNKKCGSKDYSMTLAVAHSFYNGESAEDKKMHVGAGYAMGLGTVVLYQEALCDSLGSGWMSDYVAKVLATLTSCGGGILKEVIFDRHVPNHTVDARDAIVTCKGGAAILMPQISWSF